MLPACWPSLGQLTGRNWAILSDFDVSMFFRKDRAQTEGRRDADPRIKTPPARCGIDHRRPPLWHLRQMVRVPRGMS